MHATSMFAILTRFALVRDRHLRIGRQRHVTTLCLPIVAHNVAPSTGKHSPRKLLRRCGKLYRLGERLARPARAINRESRRLAVHAPGRPSTMPVTVMVIPGFLRLMHVITACSG